ncbi:hypothetical protein WA026_008349 [Henosepilachna vigintioctopunctata]|uniref:Uncharacterized protein n=1 Tax=Henosepilachna vigintioctopunctata TaxID=420089 RepID=A0AAW1UIF6_9CUCU
MKVVDKWQHKSNYISFEFTPKIKILRLLFDKTRTFNDKLANFSDIRLRIKNEHKGENSIAGRKLAEDVSLYMLQESRVINCQHQQHLGDVLSFPLGLALTKRV